MAYDYNRNYNSRNSFQGKRGGPGKNGGNNGNRKYYDTPNTDPLALPDDYVDQAERVMQKLAQERVMLTTSKIRNILSRISDIYNVEADRTEDTLLPESVNGLQMARIRIVYECGREDSVKEFVERSNLLRYIKGVGTSRANFIRFARYMEALVAYHRFFGGKD